MTHPTKAIYKMLLTDYIRVRCVSFSGVSLARIFELNQIILIIMIIVR